MKKKYLLISFFLIAVITIITTTNVNSELQYPPVGSSGDPFTNLTCAQNSCHAGPEQTATSNEVTINIGTGFPTTQLDNNFVYIPGVTYNIALLISSSISPTPNPYYGFQMVALNVSNTQAGTMTANVSSTNTIVKTSPGTGTRQYMGHLNANATKNWAFKWTAPSAGTGAVSFYYAFNAASASTVPPSVPEGTIYKNSVTIQEGVVGIEHISSKLSFLNIFPNPVSNEFRISFDLKDANSVSSHLCSLDGKLSKELINEKMSEGNFSRVFNIKDMPAGIYLVKLNAGEASVAKKIMKL